MAGERLHGDLAGRWFEFVLHLGAPCHEVARRVEQDALRLKSVTTRAAAFLLVALERFGFRRGSHSRTFDLSIPILEGRLSPR